MIKIIINGCNGKMGQVLSTQLLLSQEFEVLAGIDDDVNRFNNPFPVYKTINEYKEEADVIIDFSHPSLLDDLIDYAIKRKVALVIATTGLTEEHIEKLHLAATEVPILYSYNMSLGINILSSVLKQISGVLKESFDIEIIEKHHNKKVDAPSGTAYLLANAINDSVGNNLDFIYGRNGSNTLRDENEIGIHTVRGGTIAGEHTIIFAGNDEVIEFKHTALSKNIFALGAMKAAKFISMKEKGIYKINDIFNFEKGE